MKRASYKTGVLWIAVNDEPWDKNLERISTLISTLLLADLFELEPAKVAADVLKYRKRYGAES